jgi:beta-glucanase (GH16 family)
MWPAFWLFGSNHDDVGWPRNGEIDVMEGKGRLPSWTSVAIHGGPDPANNRTTAAEYTLTSGSFHGEWHVFAVEWTPKSMRWYVDDVLFHEVQKPTEEDPAYWPFDNGHAFFIILNLAVGGRFDSPHGPPENLTPQRLYVDFVRVFQTAEGQ